MKTIEITECYHCGSKRYIKNGSHAGIQRYKCKDCRRHFSNHPRFDPKTKELAVRMVTTENVGIRSTGRLLNASATSILNWIKAWQLRVTLESARKIESISDENLPDIIEFDEIFTYVKKNSAECSYGLLIVGEKVALFAITSDTD
jgi:transposase-like protein